MANPLNIKAFFKFLGRNKLYTAINIFGLSVSLMFVIIAALYAYKEISVDSWHEKKDRIYVLGDDDYMGSSYGIQPYLLDRYPEIEKMAATARDEQMQVDINGEKMSADIFYADSTFFDLFDFRVLEGNGRQILETTSQAMVSESFARKVFGNKSPIGTVINIEGLVTVSVAGIMEDMGNTVFSASDIIISVHNAPKFNSSLEGLNNVGGVAQFILVREGTDLPSRKTEILEYFKTFFWVYENGWSTDVSLTPLDEIYFSSLDTGGGLRHGDKSMLLLLTGIAVLILVFAILNYINLTVAQTGFRAKEMATREFLGASRWEIFIRFIIESILMCAVAFAIGLLLAGAFQHIIGNMLQTQIDVWGSFSLASGGVAILFIVLLGAIAGVIPAVHITRYKPIDVVRGTFRQRSKMVFSKIFIVFQNVITITLIACSITIMLQIRHLMNVPLGYNTENIIYVDIWPISRDVPQRNSFAGEVENLAGVKRVSLSNSYPLYGGNNNTRVDSKGKETAFQIFDADSVFFDMMGLKIIKDNKVASGNGYWVNQRLFKELDIPEDSEYFEFGEERPLIYGVIEDFKLWNALQIEERVIITRALPRDNWFFWGLLVEVQGDKAETFNEIKDIYETRFEREFDAHYIDDELYESYQDQRRVYHMISMFTIIGVVISMLGLLAMSTYYIQQRSVEIAIRKVFGSTRGEVFNRLVRNFLKLVLIAFVIAVPLTWYLMRQWLSQFPYRINLSPWIFLAAGALAMIIAAITVMWQSGRAANVNPVNSLHKD